MINILLVSGILSFSLTSLASMLVLKYCTKNLPRPSSRNWSWRFFFFLSHAEQYICLEKHRRVVACTDKLLSVYVLFMYNINVLFFRFFFCFCLLHSRSQLIFRNCFCTVGYTVTYAGGDITTFTQVINSKQWLIHDQNTESLNRSHKDTDSLNITGTVAQDINFELICIYFRWHSKNTLNKWQYCLKVISHSHWCYMWPFQKDDTTHECRKPLYVSFWEGIQCPFWTY